MLGDGLLKVNQFVSITDENLMYGVGKYLVGTDIPAGEYYFWGEHIWFTTISQGECHYSEFQNDAYITVQRGDSLVVENGSFTLVDNILYEHIDSRFLYPNHIYRVGREIPCGIYFFKFEKQLFSGQISFCAEDDAAFNKFQQYPYHRYNQSHGYFGNVAVNEFDKYVSIKNGIAVYCEEPLPDLYSLLSSTNVLGSRYYLPSTLVTANELCAIKVFQKDCHNYHFHGKMDAIIFEQYLYSINDRKFWAGFLDVVSFKPYHWVEFTIEDLSSGKQYKFGGEHLRFKDITDISNSEKDGSICLYKLNQKDFFEIRLPDEISMEAVKVTAVRPDSCKAPLLFTATDLTSLYFSELEALAAILEKYKNIGIEIDIEKELKNFERAPDFILECYKFLEKSFEAKLVYDQKAIDKSKRITFRIEATYDKTFYCAAKLADNAYYIEASDNEAIYWVTFSGDQIEEISLMLNVLTTPFNAEREDLIEAWKYLREYDFYNYLTDSINHFIGDLRTEYGYSSFVTSSALVSINKAILKSERKKLHDLYNTMAKENRITTKWSSEYKLFMIVSKLVKDAVYQYRTEWLGQQSFDIFIPSQNVAIEYQGQQHYEPIDMFGGEEALEDNIKRDLRKRELSMAHDVKVLDWKYSVPVNQANVLAFLSEYGVIYTISEETSEVASDHIQMAPVQQVKPKTGTQKASMAERISSFVIRQFNAEGQFVAEFSSIHDAAEKSQVSERAIRKAVYGERKTGGGFIWHRCDRNSEIVSIAPVEYA